MAASIVVSFGRGMGLGWEKDGPSLRIVLYFISVRLSLFNIEDLLGDILGILKKKDDQSPPEPDCASEDEIEALEETICDLKNSLAEKSKIIEEDKEKIIQLEGDIEAHSAKIKALEERAECLDDDVTDLEEEKSEFLVEIGKLEKQVKKHLFEVDVLEKVLNLVEN
jgi:predicted RNase H-like nuclease (RuvC/YqgF family)